MSLPEPVARFAIGVDFGGSPDPTAITVVRMHRFNVNEDSFTPADEVDWSPYLENSKHDQFLFDVISQELHYDLPSHLLAERLKELANSPLYATSAQLTSTFDGVVHMVVQDKTLRPYIGIDATGAGQSTYDDMMLFGITARGYHLTSGFQATPGKRGIRNIPKLDLFSRMISAWQRGWVRVAADVPHAERLREELLNFRWKMTKQTNQLTVEHDKSTDHDDLLTALSVAIQAAIDDVGSWKRKALPTGAYTYEALGLRRF